MNEGRPRSYRLIPTKNGFRTRLIDASYKGYRNYPQEAVNMADNWKRLAEKFCRDVGVERIICQINHRYQLGDLGRETLGDRAFGNVASNSARAIRSGFHCMS